MMRQKCKNLSFLPGFAHGTATLQKAAGDGKQERGVAAALLSYGSARP